MSTESEPAVGSIVWTDLTVKNATEIKDFYSQVMGWAASPHDMGKSRLCVIQDPAGAVAALIDQ